MSKTETKPVMVRRGDELIGAFFEGSPYWAKCGPFDRSLKGAKEWNVCDRRECSDSNPDGQVAGGFLSVWSALTWIEEQSDAAITKETHHA